MTPRLPLPDSVKEMFRESEEQWIDKSEEHEGRQRSFQHERGNWATHVFCPCKPLPQCIIEVDTVIFLCMTFNLFLDDPEEAFLELLNEMMVVTAAHGIPLTLSEEFHLSLSKTVVLRHHWIQPFIQSIQTGLTPFQKSVLSNQNLIRVFHTVYSGLSSF